MKDLLFASVVSALMVMTVFLGPAPCWAQVGEDSNLEIEGRYWMPKLDSTVKVEQSGLGTDVDLVDDLGFDETEPYWEGRLQVKFAQRHKFNFAYLPFKADADKTITKTIDFAGETYPGWVRGSNPRWVMSMTSSPPSPDSWG